MSPTTMIVDDPSGLTPEWLGDALRRAGLDAAVADVAIERVGTGQLASCYRLDIAYTRGHGPDRLIAKLPATDPEVRANLGMAYRAEVRFYRDLAGSLPVDVPRSYHAEVSDDGSVFTLLLEDMAPATVGDQIVGCSADEARAAAVAVAGLHAGRWCDASIRELSWLIPSMSAFAEHLGPMLVDSVGSFIAKRDLSHDAVDVLHRFAGSFVTWAHGRPTPWSLVHNDYRLDNLLFGANEGAGQRVTAVDWQALTTGQPLCDVGFLLGTGLAPEVRRTAERDIVSAYREALLSHGVTDYPAEQCWDDYRHGLFQGPLICLLGDAFAAPSERGIEMFAVMIERSAAAILELDCFGLLDPDQ